MIQYVDISNFMTWFGNTVKDILNWIITTWNNIHIYGNVSLLTFIMAIIVIGAMIPIIITAPNKIKIKEKRRKNDK